MRLTLQEMVAGAIAEATAREKLAQAEEETSNDKKKEETSSAASAPAPEKKNGEKKDGEAEKESALKCASAATPLVEKVASALDYINGHMGLIDWTKIAQEVEPAGGPGAGPGSVIETNIKDPTAGEQSTVTGQATPQSQPEAAGKKDDVGSADGQTNAETALLTDLAHVPGGTGEQPQLKQASIRRVRGLWSMRKHASDGENPATISAGPEPKENPNASAAEEDVPKLPGPAQAQANMVRTKDPAAPADITKGEAKAEPKRQMGEVLDEPAQKKSTDPVLQQNLDAAASTGVKISSVQAAAARAYLRKVAQVGESPEATPEEKEKAQKLKEALEAKKNGNGETKEKESQFGMGGAQTPPVPPTPMM